GRPCAGLFVWCAGPATRSLPCNPIRNKPLMACSQHWKSARVLPMFRMHPLASDPGFRRCAPERGATDASGIAGMDEAIKAKRQQTAGSGMRAITIRGAREHNLKNVDLE